MTEQRILELEQQLRAANEAIVKLASANTDLTAQLAEAALRSKRLRRSSQRGEASLRQELTVAQNRKF